MAESAYWFRHDTNAKDDHKIMLLIDQLGLEGYGIYWVLIETLREQNEYKYPLAMLPILAKRYCSSAEKFKTVVTQYQLFDVFEDDTFASLSLLRRMEAYDNIILKRKESGALGGKARAEKRKLSKCLPNAKQTDSKHVANRVDKSRIENIYDLYPKKVGRGAALKSIEKALRKIASAELEVAVIKYAESVRGKDKQFIPNPATWFNQERWMDEHETDGRPDYHAMSDEDLRWFAWTYWEVTDSPELNGVEQSRQQTLARLDTYFAKGGKVLPPKPRPVNVRVAQ